MNVLLLFGVSLLACGGVVVLAGVRARRPAFDVAGWLEDGFVSGEPVPEAAERGAHPFAVSVARRAPGPMLERAHRAIVQAGLASQLRAEELVAVQLLVPTGAVALAIAWSAATGAPARLAMAAVLLAAVGGWAAPRSYVVRTTRARHDSMRRDLPDVLDLMAISMEAGVAFDGALAVVADHFRGPLADELLLTLREMELGLPRRDALQNLRRRCDVAELSYVVVALLQADALGMPVARVLRTQATEMRNRRRQWAREKAGKLPVKIIFPLVAFIFPPILVVILGPAWPGISSIF